MAGCPKLLSFLVSNVERLNAFAADVCAAIAN
jgi:hypothetical protein